MHNSLRIITWFFSTYLTLGNVRIFVISLSVHFQNDGICKYSQKKFELIDSLMCHFSTISTEVTPNVIVVDDLGCIAQHGGDYLLVQTN